MSLSLKIKKGIDLHLNGGIPRNVKPLDIGVTQIGLVPDDFVGMIPKIVVKPGDTISAGDELWHDKNEPAIKVVSPVKGVVKDVVRGEKRKVLRVVINVEPELSGKGYEIPETEKNTDIKCRLKDSGLWAMIRQLPYYIVPVDGNVPVNIFITAWDAAPLSAGYDEYLQSDRIDYLRKGVKTLKGLTSGNVYIGYRSGDDFPQIEDAITVGVEGKYPSSLPSILSANICPVNKGETVWLLDADTAVRIGQLTVGTDIDWTFPVAVTGSEVQNPCLLTVPVGTCIENLLAHSGMKEGDHHRRIISGNVFVGEKSEPNGFLRYPYHQLTVIPEGDDITEFMGWASVSPNKMSSSRSFPSFFMRKRNFTPDARLNGGRRSLIMSGEYSRYIPMDIMPEYLIKAILARDIERMEALGIYEVTPADFSVAEYADTSKLELQHIVREGLDYMLKEVGIN